jgi:endonuclease/exonuclease/phosphatase family metal-dependent hydrolase
MRVLQLNVWGVRGDWERRREVLRREVTRLRPDLVTFQEVIRTDDYDQAADVLGPEYQFHHQLNREKDGQGVTTASRWPIGRMTEVDLQLSERTADFACTALATEVTAPDPIGRVWLVNNFPSWQLDQEAERTRQAAETARALQRLLSQYPGHAVVAGDFDADPDSDSIRFWTGRHVVDRISVCFRDAWSSAHPDEPGHTYVPDNPFSEDWDWPFRRIDYILVGCDLHGGPTLAVESCDRVLDGPETTVSDHYGVLAELVLPPRGG